MTLGWLPGAGTPLPAAAGAYAAHGWPVFPVARDKRPLTSHGFADASADADQVAWWWKRWPDSGIGWPVSAGLVVVDVDPRHGGNESRGALEAEHGKWPETLRAKTGGGGEHWAYRLPDGIEARQLAGWRPGLDTRAAGRGYVVLAPSGHPSGGRYTWAVTNEPAIAPEWLVEEIRVRPEPARVPFVPPSTSFGITRRQRYAAAVLKGEAAEVAASPSGSRNARLFRAWMRCAELRDVIDRADAERELTTAALAAGLPEHEIAKVLR